MNRIFQYSVVIILLLSLIACKEKWQKPAVNGNAFSMIIASDPQFYWWAQPPCSTMPTKTKKEKREKENCVEKYAKISNDAQFSVMNKIVINSIDWPTVPTITRDAGMKAADVVGLVINGDLTSYWHPGEKKAFEADFLKYAKNKKLEGKIAPFFGLGNHDYYNNLCDCSGFWPFDKNSCSRNAVNTARDWYSHTDWIKFDQCSLAYSFDFKGYHFAQLHLAPSYQVNVKYHMSKKKCDVEKYKPGPTCGKSNVLQSFDWLDSDLKAAAAGERSILFFHVAGDKSDEPKYWPVADQQRFKKILNTHNVVAIFSGHIHQYNGYQGQYQLGTDPVPIINSNGNQIPYFRSGASEYYTFLMVEFGPDYMNVGVINSKNNTPTFLDINNSDKLSTYLFN